MFKVGASPDLFVCTDTEIFHIKKFFLSENFYQVFKFLLIGFVVSAEVIVKRFIFIFLILLFSPVIGVPHQASRRGGKKAIASFIHSSFVCLTQH